MRAQWAFGEFANPCLLVVDAQEKYHTDAFHLPRAVPRIAEAIRAARRRGWSVYWTRYSRSPRPDGSMRRFYGGRTEADYGVDAARTAIVPALHPRRFGLSARGRVFRTRHLSSFSSPALEARLCAHDLVVLCGGWTDHCITATAHDAFGRELSVCVLEDACFAQKRSGRHAEAIAVLRGSIARIASVAELDDAA
jgi:nicotinamidase-related amidase